MKSKHPPALVAIVVYKALVALLLALTAMVLLLALENYQSVEALSQPYILEGKLRIIELLLEKITNLKRQTLEFGGIAAGLYAAVTAIEAIGLWYQRSWARLLVVGLVGISIPPELFELSQGMTLLKSAVFLVNIAVFWYLLRHFPQQGRSTRF
ncbi:MAG TPA: DUF2127 domain-containing protein [Candidatus Caenarcaniphilales bacterium]